MDVKTIILFLGMYIYGFGLMIWAIFYDKRPTKLSVTAAKLGMAGLILTVFYCIYVLWVYGITD